QTSLLAKLAKPTYLAYFELNNGFLSRGLDPGLNPGLCLSQLITHCKICQKRRYLPRRNPRRGSAALLLPGLLDLGPSLGLSPGPNLGLNHGLYPSLDHGLSPGHYQSQWITR
ncbi:hypothetical protein MTO96_036571, partial [Rhipicephalus appendiculatus]